MREFTEADVAAGVLFCWTSMAKAAIAHEGHATLNIICVALPSTIANQVKEQLEKEAQEMNLKGFTVKIEACEEHGMTNVVFGHEAAFRQMAAGAQVENFEEEQIEEMVEQKLKRVE